MARQGGIKGWEKNDSPEGQYIEVWKTYSTDDEVRTERSRRRYPTTIRVWEEIDGEHAVETERGDMDREEFHASRRRYDTEDKAKEEAKRRMRRINEEGRFFAENMSEDEIDHVIGAIRHSSRNQGQLGSRLERLGSKLRKGHKESKRRRIP